MKNSLGGYFAEGSAVVDGVCVPQQDMAMDIDETMVKAGYGYPYVNKFYTGRQKFGVVARGVNQYPRESPRFSHREV